MIVLRIFQALVGVALALAAALVQGHAPPFGFGLSVVGESEQANGSWQGVDLLLHPGAPAERFQILVRPTQGAQFTLDELTPDGPRRIYPAAGQSGLLRADRAYALPGPRQFYERSGPTHLRLAVGGAGSASGRGGPGPARSGRISQDVARLSDGSRMPVTEQSFTAGEGGWVDLGQ